MPRTNTVEERKLARSTGNRLRELRSLKGMTQTELGERVGVTFQQVQKYERGTNHMTIWKLVQFAEALGIGVDEFLGRSGVSTEEGGLVTRRAMLDAIRGLNEIEQASPEMFKAICHLIRASLAETK